MHKALLIGLLILAGCQKQNPDYIKPGEGGTNKYQPILYATTPEGCKVYGIVRSAAATPATFVVVCPPEVFGYVNGE